MRRRHFVKLAGASLFLPAAIATGQQAFLPNRRTAFRQLNANLVNGLVGWWPFKEGAGLSTKDQSGNGNTGTLSGGTPPAWVTGLYGSGALNFDGITQQVTVANATNLNSYTSITLSGWVYLNAYDATTGSCLITKNANEPIPVDPYELYFSGLDTTGHILFALSNGTISTRVLITNAAVVPLGVWAHIVETWDGTTMKTYMNGSLDAITGTFTSTVGSNSLPVRIGALNLTTAFAGWNGNIDDVRIYNRALTAAEVAQIYTNGPI